MAKPKEKQAEESEPSPEEKAREKIAKAFEGLKLRSIGPAVMGGRIADIAVHPQRPGTWYVAVGSGGLWKTSNAGTTFQPLFDKQPSYSLGCVALDPNNPEVVWVGTGENVSGRHVGWGDGVYRSRDAGRTWEQMGLAASEHIGKIIVDPRDGNVVYAAAEGPLWSAGGERGLYKTSDGGATWRAVLEIDPDTGVTDVEMDPSNPDVLYAAAYQRRRHIWAFMGGGPGSGIYKSSDAGETWRQVKEGLPKGDMGKIGLAVTPADPTLVYATIEANEEERGFYRSRDRGESWERRNEYLSGGTGPHYYQEIEASPSDPDLVYQMDVFVHVTRDGGKTFANLETGKEKHSDNHALWIDPQDGKHLLVGTDAGLYETFDEGKTYRHFPNLPVSQFYRLALDNASPFYNVLGGAQDLGTLLGPTRTTNIEGVRNQDWSVPLGADGYHTGFDPEDPDTMYLEWQGGNVMRYDRRSDEAVDIKPMPEPGDPPERWNWDTPILVSPHDPHRLYVASQRVWRSDNRGDSWTAISPDLTHNRNRYELPHFDRVWSVDDLYDTGAMSKYATISILSESPLVEGLLYAGTDDGRIQVRDGGGDWRAAEDLPGVPAFAFIQDVEAGCHDPDTVFAVADAHKVGDYSPYVFESRDRGRTWRSIAGDLPEGTIGWAIEQDDQNPDLLFLGSEFGLYASPDRGERWFKLGGAPTIAFRDIEIQRRDGDLVGATFGRGFYVLDDYAPLRSLAEYAQAGTAALFPVRDAWWYVPNTPMQSPGQPTLGSSSFKAANPPFGALFRYYLPEALKSPKKARQENEKELRKEQKDIPFPGWERLRREAVAREPQVLILVRDSDGAPVRWLEGTNEAGLQQASWDLRRDSPDPINLVKPEFVSPWSSPPQGPLVPPGRYSALLYFVTPEGIEAQGEAQDFEVKAIPSAPEGTDFDSVTAFQSEVAALMRRVHGTGKELERSQDRIRHLKAALGKTPGADAGFYERIDGLVEKLAGIQRRLSGDEVRQKLNEAAEPSVRDRAGRVAWMGWDSREAPTATQRRAIELAAADFETLRQELAALIDTELAALEADLEAAGAPWTPGRRLG